MHRSTAEVRRNFRVHFVPSEIHMDNAQMFINVTWNVCNFEAKPSYDSAKTRTLSTLPTWRTERCKTNYFRFSETIAMQNVTDLLPQKLTSTQNRKRKIQRILYIRKSSRLPRVVVQRNVDIADRAILPEHPPQVFGPEEEEFVNSSVLAHFEPVPLH